MNIERLNNDLCEELLTQSRTGLENGKKLGMKRPFSSVEDFGKVIASFDGKISPKHNYQNDMNIRRRLSTSLRAKSHRKEGAES